MRQLYRGEPHDRVNMKQSAFRFLILTCLFAVALCWWNRLVSERKSWEDANKYCQDHHTDLSSISNPAEDESFNTMVEPDEDRTAWIGLYLDTLNWWRWSGGQFALFFNWAKWQNSSNHNRCVVQTQNGWRRRNCQNRVKFYCFDDSLVLVKENKTWEEALEHCRSEHIDLVSLPFESALDHTLQTSTGAQTDHVWINLRYLADEWLWVNGYKVGYQAWSKEETLQCPTWTHRCGALSLDGRQWVKRDCAEKLNFVCHQ